MRYERAMASAPTSYPAWLAGEERHAARRLLSLPARLAGERVRGDAIGRTMDITALGCRLAVAEPPPVGSYVAIDVAGCSGIAGWVAWSRNGQLGVDFAHPLPDAVVEHLLGLSLAAPR